jgi:hypothetical protein
MTKNDCIIFPSKISSNFPAGYLGKKKEIFEPNKNSSLFTFFPCEQMKLEACYLRTQISYLFSFENTKRCYECPSALQHASTVTVSPFSPEVI